jgi:hypothetical protein
MTTEDTWEQVTTFEGFVHKWTGDAQSNLLLVTIGVKTEHKYDAMPVTDRPGEQLRVTIERIVYEAIDDE